MAVAFGTVQVAYGGATNTIITSPASTPSSGVAVAFVCHTQSGITNTGVSSSVDGAFSSSGTRIDNGQIVTAWELQSLSNASMTYSATFSDTWGANSHLAVHPATGAHASAAFGDYATSSGNSTTPSITISNFSSGDGVVDCVMHGSGGTSVVSGNNVEEYEDQTGQNCFGSKNTTDGVMSWTAEFSNSWAQAGMRIVQAAAGGATGKSNPLWGPLGGPLYGTIG